MKKLPRKPRSAKILFERNTPFKPKIVQSKKVYSRKKRFKDVGHD